MELCRELSSFVQIVWSSVENVSSSEENVFNSFENVSRSAENVWSSVENVWINLDWLQVYKCLYFIEYLNIVSTQRHKLSTA